MIIFDIETEPLPNLVIPELDPASIEGLATGEFDPSMVKIGNTKNPVLINEKIERARIDFEERKANSAIIIKEARERHAAEFLASSTLSPVHSQILAIGYYSPSKSIVKIHADLPEKDLLSVFWNQFDRLTQEKRSLVGVGIFGFDLPYMIRRCWITGVPVPDNVFAHGHFHYTFVDLSVRWQMYSRWRSEPASFESLAQAFGTLGKNGKSGADFYKLWKSDRQSAVDYLTSDVKQPAIWAEKMGVLQ